MNKILISVVAGFALILGASVSHADDQSSGCGAGWYVTKRNSLLSSLVRSSTNYTFSNTIGMTFGTSGCARHDLVMNDKKEIHYAESNYNNLVVEMAQGGGEHLRGFAAVLGCDPASYEAFSSMTQSNYLRIFSTDGSTPNGLINQVKAQMKNDPSLAFSCLSVI
jgi:hypothetical protein